MFVCSLARMRVYASMLNEEYVLKRAVVLVKRIRTIGNGFSLKNFWRPNSKVLNSVSKPRKVLNSFLKPLTARELS